jgi:hypothetical protein
MEALQIVAGSWPIAVMVIGVSAAVVVRRSLKQVMDNDRAKELDRAQGNNAVVVTSRTNHRDD